LLDNRGEQLLGRRPTRHQRRDSSQRRLFVSERASSLFRYIGAMPAA
jgi:hypothetical protein